ncbi:OST-HTH/LOTUS domain-containing protein [Pseudacidovorax sp. NFM-22]|uniref:OST-HTH/LOTUS domain-containing protein n=1 Tax=Pseudacidovorax sp. NFM-22 TaxID=2744469 RepID=UPI001F364D0A|nr:OST-HTH/LOTUS domain-containing protein [Pseudacidovorax sp. NFM-22]
MSGSQGFADACRARDSSWAHLGDVGGFIGKNHASFDARNYGHNKLSELVRKQPFLHVGEVAHASGADGGGPGEGFRRPVTSSGDCMRATLQELGRCNFTCVVSYCEGSEPSHGLPSPQLNTVTQDWLRLPALRGRVPSTPRTRGRPRPRHVAAVHGKLPSRRTGGNNEL